MDVKQQLRDQIWWARLQLCKAQKAESWTDEQAWTGYLNALHWVEDFLLDTEWQAATHGRRSNAATQPINLDSMNAIEIID